MYKSSRIIPILAVSGALALGTAALPATPALAAEIAVSPSQAVVQKINAETYRDMLEGYGCTEAEIDSYLQQLAAGYAQADQQQAAATPVEEAGGADSGSESGSSSASEGSSESTGDELTAEEQAAKEQAEKDAAAAQAAKEQAEKEAAAKEQAAQEQAAKEAAAREAAAKEQAAKEAAAQKAAAEKAQQEAAARQAAEQRAAAQRAAEARANAKVAHAQHAAPAPAPVYTYTDTYTYEDTSTSSAESYSRIHYSQNLTTEMFIASIAEQARQIGQKYGLYASVMIAQAILESGSGSSTLSKAPYNNLFGIKGAYKGKFITMVTQEDNGFGGLYTISSSFRVYPSLMQSLKDYAKLLTQGTFYEGAWKVNAKTYEEAAQALQGRYATDTSYAAKIDALIETYDLTRFDEKLDYEVVGTMLKKDNTLRAMTMNDYAKLEAIGTSLLGTPYLWGGSTKDGMDCSGFVQYVYRKALGIELPRTTYEQQNVGTTVDFKDLQMGDLLFFNDGSSTYHVGMYLGDGFYIHSMNEGVQISDMETFTPSFAKRIVTTQKIDKEKEDETEKIVNPATDLTETQTAEEDETDDEGFDDEETEADND